MLRYDERQLTEAVVGLTRAARATFVALCAERLVPLGESYFSMLEGDELRDYRSVLDCVWSHLLAQPVSRDALAAAEMQAEELVPDEEDESWNDLGAYGQNGAAAAAYAVRTLLTDDPTEALRCAYQAYEAADFAAQQILTDLDLNGPGAEVSLLSSPVVQHALAGIGEDLDSVRARPVTERDDLQEMRQRARLGGERLAQLAEVLSGPA